MTVYHKPSAFTKAMNSVIKFLAERGIGPKATISLEVKGRRSGQTRSAVVNTIDHDGGTYLVAPRGNTEWVRNVRAAGGEAVIRRGKRRPVRLEEVAEGERAPIIKSYLAKNAMVTKKHFGVEPDASIEEFERIAPDHPVFTVSYTGDGTE